MRDYYDVLEISRDASEVEIKKAYRNLAKQYHPDKVSGYEEEFKEISAAYEILSDSEKRAHYDQYGFESNLGDQGNFDPFANMFNFGGFNQFEQEPAPGTKRKSPKVVFPFNVTLEDLYNGKNTKFQLERTVECSTCHGKGGKSKTAKKCQGCDGAGQKVKIKQVGNGMLQQVQVQCEACDGTGTSFSIKDRCKKCKGKKVAAVNKLIEVFIEKGMVDHQKLVFKGDADQQPGKEAGDLIIELIQQDHPIFERHGSDLFTTVKINLKDALCGFNNSFFTSLDKRNILIQANPGQVLVKDHILVIKHEGMPQYKAPYDKGDLFVKFEIIFPTQQELKDINLKLLSSLLPETKKNYSKVNKEYATESVDLISSNKNPGDNKAEGERYRQLQEEEEEEENNGFQGMECNQQ